MVMKRAVGGIAILMLTACGSHNNRLLGRVQETVGGHLVVVTDCYRIIAPPPVQFVEGGQIIYRYTPCRDADVLLRDGNLIVNGRSYGRLNPHDGVLVDHTGVSIQRR
jgi:hypothetical protein